MHFHELTDTATETAYHVNLFQISRYVVEDDFAVLWLSDGGCLTITQEQWLEIKPVLERESKRGRKPIPQ